MPLHKGFSAALAMLLTFAAASAASAQSAVWPNRPVKFILPLGPGSGADIGARLIAEQLSVRWGQPVIVENRPGGDAFVAISAFVNAKDDHILFYSPSASFVVHPYLHTSLPYNPADLVPITRITNTILSIAIPKAATANTLADVFAEARANPGKMNWATAAGGTDFVVAGFLKEQQLDMAKVPYRDTVQAINDVVESRIQFYASAYAIVRAQVEAGKLKLLAVTNEERAPTLKDTPTVTELGYPKLTFEGLIGIFGPRDMPAGARERITADVKEIAANPSIVQRLESTGQIVHTGGSADFAAAIEKQKASLVETARILGVKAAQ